MTTAILPEAPKTVSVPSFPPLRPRVSFKVHDVDLLLKRFDKKPIRDVIVEGMGRKNPEKDGTSMCLMNQEALEPYKVLGVSHETNILTKSERTGHPLLHAIHYAFDYHLALTLSPDIIWQTILQGVSHHIAQYPEEYRHLFVKHESQKILTIFRSDLSLGNLPAVGAATDSIVDEFIQLIGGEVSPAYFNVFQGGFSTTARAEHVAAAITCMEAFSPYFGYHMYCGCGFPMIHLDGSVDDWRVLKAKILQIEELFYLNADINLTWWTEKLREVADQFIVTAQGNPNIAWWKKMYKQIDVYLSHQFNGWIGWLWPYTKTHTRWDGTKHVQPEKAWQRSPMLTDLAEQIAITKHDFGGKENEKRLVDIDSKPSLSFFESASLPFMYTNDFPLGLSQAALKITDVALQQTLDTVLIGGFVGVSQDEDGGLKPEIGYALLA